MRTSDGGIARQIRRRLHVCLAAALLGHGAAAKAEGDETGATASLTVASDYMLRGFSQSKGKPVVQGGAAYTTASSWTLGAWGSSVDFVDAGQPSDGAHVELDLYVSRAWTLSEHVGFDATLIRYVYPSTVPGVSYDYNELILAFHVTDIISTTLIYSNDAFATQQPALLGEIAAQYPLPHGLELSGRLGYYDLEDAFGARYSYYSVGLAKQLGKFTLAWRYDGADRAGRELWGDDARGRMVLQLSTDF